MAQMQNSLLMPIYSFISAFEGINVALIHYDTFAMASKMADLRFNYVTAIYFLDAYYLLRTYFDKLVVLDRNKL